MWQEIIVGFCVLAALAFLLRRWLPNRKSAGCDSGCGGCGSASNCSTTPEKKIVPHK